LGLYKTEAVVLRARDLGEADRILTLYSREYGKLDAVAKGVKKMRSKMGGSAQPLTYSSFLLYRGCSLDTVTGCEPKEMFAGIRENLTSWAYGTYMMELLSCILPQRVAQESVFALLLTGLHLLASGPDPELSVRFWEVHLLRLLGYQPELEYCAACRQKIRTAELAFSARLGGIVCSHCAGLDPTAFRVKGGEIAIWRRLLQLDSRHLFRLKPNADTRQRLAGLLQYYLQYHLEKRLKSTDFIQHLRSFPSQGVHGSRCINHSFQRENN
jgi:DNA repair protein RecO (recombination protein O)